MRLADLLVALRRRKKLRQKQVAAAAQIDASYLAGLESGRRDMPSVKVLERILTALAASPRDRLRAGQALALGRIERELARVDSPPAGTESVLRIAACLPEATTTEVEVVDAVANLLEQRLMSREGVM